MYMTRLILAMDDTGAGTLRDAGLADIVLPFGFRLVWGPLPSDAEFVTAVAPRSAQHVQITDHWLWNVHRKHLGETGSNEIGLIDLCERCETIELWIDPDPNAQLTLIWLLDYLRHHAKIASKLTLVQADAAIAVTCPSKWRHGGCRPSEFSTIIWNKRAQRGGPIEPRPPRTGSTCCQRT